MEGAWNFIGLSLNKVIGIFNRLFSAFELGDVILPLIFMTASVSFLIMPILRRITFYGSDIVVKKAFKNGSGSNSKSKG